MKKSYDLTLKKSMTLTEAIVIFVLGVFIGTVFTFGMQYWNAEVTRDKCNIIEAEFSYYEERRTSKRATEIAVYCANGENYYIDGVCINEAVRNDLYMIEDGESIKLLIHPNSNTIVELLTDRGYVLNFEDTILQLGNEAKGFMFLGVFMYFSALIGLYNIVSNIKKQKK